MVNVVVVVTLIHNIPLQITCFSQNENKKQKQKTLLFLTGQWDDLWPGSSEKRSQGAPANLSWHCEPYWGTREPTITHLLCKENTQR